MLASTHRVAVVGVRAGAVDHVVFVVQDNLVPCPIIVLAVLLGGHQQHVAICLQLKLLAGSSLFHVEQDASLGLARGRASNTHGRHTYVGDAAHK